MTADREQIRRDAERKSEAAHAHVREEGRDMLALLAELEQAERELAHRVLRYKTRCRELNAAEARLAKVPALVEALRAFIVIHPGGQLDPDRVGKATRAIAAWESE